jgi:hypothetical protein
VLRVPWRVDHGAASPAFEGASGGQHLSGDGMAKLWVQLTRPGDDGTAQALGDHAAVPAAWFR